MQLPPPLPPEYENDTPKGARNAQVMADTIIGINLRGKDNRFQAIGVTIGMLLGIIGYVIFYVVTKSHWSWSGCLVCIALGLIGATFITGIALAFYRMRNH